MYPLSEPGPCPKAATWFLGCFSLIPASLPSLIKNCLKAFMARCPTGSCLESSPLMGPSGFPGGSDGKESACNERDLGSVPGLGRSLGEGYSSPLQHSCLETPMDRGAWRAVVQQGHKGSDMTERLSLRVLLLTSSTSASTVPVGKC